ncbi:hypothetical protein [Planctobacterium marinum]|uniref:Uncharacterized protein n=1 Tax=Planctobacterium marinum TaxID=1631968 RepID=A0AA48I2H2_9ALTE|nr:hypothetical protein MACH26_02310 [Planctobacterium marinum]
MTELLAKTIVCATSVFLIGLALGAFVLPERIASFLNSFASSARVHFTEMLLRLTVGLSFVAISEEMTFSRFFELFGWVLIITSAILIVLPWQLHKRFADLVVPPLTKRVWLFGLLSLPLGLAIAASMLIA